MSSIKMFSIDEARNILRIDNTDNDQEILSLVDAIPDYIYNQTGYKEGDLGFYSPIALTAGRFILWQWYYGENADTNKLQRVIECLLKALSAERKL